MGCYRPRLKKVSASAYRPDMKSTVLVLLLVISSAAQSPQKSNGEKDSTGSRQEIAVVLIGYADRWGEFSSYTDSPSVRDFLAVIQHHRNPQPNSEKFIKLRFEYWPQDHSDPKLFAQEAPPISKFYARRTRWCDEAFNSLSREGESSTVDSKAPPSRFLRLKNGTVSLPSAEEVLPCYVVRWPKQ